MSENFDVIIIGSGSVGVPLSMYLAEKKLKVLVVEKNASTGQGQNKCAIGGIRASHSDTAKMKVCMKSLEIFSNWQKIFGENIGWVKGGYLYPVYADAEEKLLKDLLKVQKRLALNIDWINADKVAELMPGINREELRGGTFSPDDGSASPLISNNAFFRHAVRLGVKFHFLEHVTDVLKENDSVCGVKTDRGTYHSKIVVNAAGAEAAEVSKLFGVTIPVNPDCHEAGITEPVQRFFEPMVVDIRRAEKSANYYFYQNSEDQIVFCITPRPQIWGDYRLSTSNFLPEASKRIISLVPKMANVRIRRTWRGLYPMTPDGSPIVGFSKEVKGYVMMTGMCGQGFMLGPGLGCTLAAAINGDNTATDDEILAGFSPDRSFSGQEKLE